MIVIDTSFGDEEIRKELGYAVANRMSEVAYGIASLERQGSQNTSAYRYWKECYTRLEAIRASLGGAPNDR